MCRCSNQSSIEAASSVGSNRVRRNIDENVCFSFNFNAMHTMNTSTTIYHALADGWLSCSSDGSWNGAVEDPISVKAKKGNADSRRK
jgi:hypothetical protein